jgi:hypothetical protein
MDKLLYPNAYWESRQDLLYYQVVRQLIKGLAPDADSMLDVGSAGCPYLDWFRHIPVRVSVDIDRPFAGEGITAIKADFVDWQPDRDFSVVTCLQVLEHVEQPAIFARKLLAAGRIVIVSVPHLWLPGTVDSHRHDPVTERKMRAWFGREPNFSYICREVLVRSHRLIQVYEQSPFIWTNLTKRASLEASRDQGEAVAPAARTRISKRIRKSARRYWLQLRNR